MLFNNKYRSTVLSLYTNFILQGMVVLLLARNSRHLSAQMGVSSAGFAWVIAAIGFGRILMLYPAGFISDKINRKLVTYLGMICYIVFFIGMPLSNNLALGIIVAMFAGFSNAFLDTGTYPTLLEAMPEHYDSVSVLNRAFISIGQFILPLILSFLIWQNLHFSLAFFFCLIILMINMVAFRSVPFPQINDDLKIKREKIKKEVVKSNLPLRSKYLSGALLILFSYTCVATFNIFVNWSDYFVKEYVGMSDVAINFMMSIYALLSFVSVFVTAILVKKIIRPASLTFIYVLLSVIGLVPLIIYPSVLTAYIAVLAIGFFATGGIWQLGLALLLDIFPNNKGKITSYYSLSTSMALVIMPIVAGQLAIRHLMTFNALIAFTGLILISSVMLIEKLNLKNN